MWDLVIKSSMALGAMTGIFLALKFILHMEKDQLKAYLQLCGLAVLVIAATFILRLININLKG